MKTIFLLLTLLGYSFLYSQAPAVKFSNTTGCIPLVVLVKDTATYVGKTAVNRTWYWGDNTSFTNTSDTGSHAYFQSGYYSVKLVVSFSNGSKDSTNYSNIIYVYPKTNIKYLINPNTACNPGKICFYNQSVYNCGGKSSLTIDYGDGNIDDSIATKFYGDTICHTYQFAGNYNVKFIVRNTCGCLADTMYLNGVIIKQTPKAKFVLSDTFSCTNTFAPKFTNTSTAPAGTTYQWLFGDGGYSNLTSPTHLYSAPPFNFNVQLIAINPDGNCRDTFTKLGAFAISTKVVNFSADRDSVCAFNSDTIKFINQTAGVTGCYYDFGDGTNVYNCNPSKVYATPGKYTVTYTAYYLEAGKPCAKSKTMNIYVEDKPKIQFYASDSIFCLSTGGTKLVTFSNKTVGAVSYFWNFGNGSPVTSNSFNGASSISSTSTIKLYATSKWGCVDSLIKPNYINTSGIIDNVIADPQSGCIPLKRNFKDMSVVVRPGDSIVSIQWDFNGDGIIDKVGDTGSYYYPTLNCGFNARRIATTKFGCVSIYDMPLQQGIKMKPNVQFGAFFGCKLDKMQVKYTGQIPISCPDRMSVIVNPGPTNIKYNGLFDTIKLPFIGIINQKFTIMTDYLGCTDTFSKDTITRAMGPRSQFNVNAPITCNVYDRSHINLSNTSIAADSFWWYDNNVLFSRASNPSPVSITPGCHDFKLIAYNVASGCYDTSQMNLKSRYCYSIDTAGIYVSHTMCCTNTNVKFSMPTPSYFKTQEWFLSGGGLNNVLISTLVNDVYLFKDRGDYTLKLITTDNYNCKDTVVKKILVNIPVVTLILDSPICKNTDIKITARTDSTYIPIYTHIFNDLSGPLGSINMGAQNYIYYKFPNAGTRTIAAVVRDSIGCQVTKFMNIDVLDINAQFSKSRDSICIGQSVSFTSDIPDTNYIHQWSFQDGFPANSNLENPSNIVFNSLGNKLVKHSIFNKATGCVDTFIDTVHIIKLVVDFYTNKSSAFCNATTVSFFDSSKGNILKYFWEFGDGSGLNQGLKNPQYTYLYPKKYFIKLLVESNTGCRDSIIKNAFTLNGPFADYSLVQLDSCENAPMKIVTQAQYTTKIEIVTGLGVSTFIYPSGLCGSLSNPYCADSVYFTLTSAGLYTPQIYVTDGTCNYYLPVKSQQINIYNRPKANFRLLDSSFCKDALIQIFDSSIFTSYYYKKYNWVMGGDTSTSTNPIVLSNFPSSKKVTLYLSSTPTCVDSISKNITVHPLPNVDFTFVDTCQDIPISFNNLASISNTQSFVWNFDNGIFNSVDFNPTQSFNIPKSYAINLKLVDKNNCKNEQTKILNIKARPNLSLWSDTIKCIGDTLDIAVYKADNISFVGLNNAVLKNDTTLTVFNKQDQNYTVKAINAGCAEMVKAIKVEVAPEAKVEITALPNRIESGQSSQLNLNANQKITSILWSPTENLSCIDCDNPVANPSQSTIYNAKVVYTYKNKSCLVNNPVEIIVDNRSVDSLIRIPKIFSPNGDGKNDQFRMKLIDPNLQLKDYVCRIYNRWGEMVFESKDIDVFWDGSYKGIDQPQGAYVIYYELNIVGKKPIISMQPLNLIR